MCPATSRCTAASRSLPWASIVSPHSRWSQGSWASAFCSLRHTGGGTGVAGVREGVTQACMLVHMWWLRGMVGISLLQILRLRGGCGGCVGQRARLRQGLPATLRCCALAPDACCCRSRRLTWRLGLSTHPNRPGGPTHSLINWRWNVWLRCWASAAATAPITGAGRRHSSAACRRYW